MVNLWCTAPWALHLSTSKNRSGCKILDIGLWHLPFNFYSFSLQTLVIISSYIDPLSLFACHSGRCKAELDPWLLLVHFCYDHSPLGAPHSSLLPWCFSAPLPGRQETAEREDTGGTTCTHWVASQNQATCSLLTGKTFFIECLRKMYSLMYRKRAMLLNGTFNSCFRQSFMDA